MACTAAEPVGGKLGISHRVLDALVPEVVLQRARVVTVVCQFETAGMAEHVRVHAKRHLGAFPSLVIILRKPTVLVGAPARSSTKAGRQALNGCRSVLKGCRSTLNGLPARRLPHDSN